MITLMRHGRPLLAAGGWVHAAGMADWIDGYDAAVVERSEVPPDAQAIASAAHVIVSSTLARAISSAHALGREPDLVEAMFCEAQLPHALWRLVKLPPSLWAVGFRLAWRCGYGNGVATYRDSRRRAALAAQRLIDLSAHGPVLLVGHGIMNRMIGAELKARGWSGDGRQASSYWSCTVFSRPS